MKLMIALLIIASFSQAHAGVTKPPHEEQVNPHVLVTTTPDGKHHNGTMFLYLSECNKEQQRLENIEVDRFAHNHNMKKMTRYNCLQK